MKKIAFSILAAVLLLTLVCSSALALTGDMTIKAAKAYSDQNMTQYIGTIPKYTSVKVRAYGTYADVIVNGVECYVHPETLTQGKYDYSYLGTATLKKGAAVYQRPTASAKYATNRKSCKVKVFAVDDGLALIRNSKGVFGFTSVNNLSAFK